MCSYVWLWVAICGYGWVCIPMCGYVWTWVPMFTYVWLYVAMCSYLCRAVASGGQGGTASLWMDLFSLDSVIFIIVTCNCLPFQSEPYLMTSAENSVLECKKLNIFWGRISPEPPTRLVRSTLEIIPPPPRYKKPTCGMC